jgi:hypothetical protein
MNPRDFKCEIVGTVRTNEQRDPLDRKALESQVRSVGLTAIAVLISLVVGILTVREAHQAANAAIDSANAEERMLAIDSAPYVMVFCQPRMQTGDLLKSAAAMMSHPPNDVLFLYETGSENRYKGELGSAIGFDLGHMYTVRGGYLDCTATNYGRHAAMSIRASFQVNIETNITGNYPPYIANLPIPGLASDGTFAFEIANISREELQITPKTTATYIAPPQQAPAAGPILFNCSEMMLGAPPPLPTAPNLPTMVPILPGCTPD